MITIYKITNTLNGKPYVGQTRQPIEKRFMQHSKADSPLGQAMRECGSENFTIEVIEMCETQEQANERERFWIKVLKSKLPTGYNQRDGGAVGSSKKRRMVIGDNIRKVRLALNMTVQMTIETRLKHLILSQYKSLMAFANAAGVPYTTLDSMLKRGVMNAGVGKVVKICQCLGISADGLADGEIIPYETSEIKFNRTEKELLQKYRALDERGKKAVDETLSREYDYSTHELTEEEVSEIFEAEINEVAKLQSKGNTS